MPYFELQHNDGYYKVHSNFNNLCFQRGCTFAFAIALSQTNEDLNSF